MRTTHSKALTFGSLLGLANVMLCPWAFAQDSAELALPPNASLCTPQCASGFECNQGFCVAIERNPDASEGGSIDAPGLALGAPTAVVPATHKVSQRERSLPPPTAEEDDDEDRDDRPKTEDIQDWTDYRHQGFYLRFGLGGGLGWITGRRSEFDAFGGERMNGSGLAEGDFSIGGSVGPVAFGYRGLVSPFVGFSGGFIDVYPDPLEGLHLEAALGINGTSNGEPTFTLGVGHDFFFAREWSFGVTARALRTFDEPAVSSVTLSASLLCH